MSDRTLILFDDSAARAWAPFALTRPAGELLLGALTQRERAERVLGVRCAGYVAAEHLREFEEEGAPGVLDPAALPGGGDRIFLSTRAIVGWDASLPHGSEGGPVRIAGEVVGWYAPAGSPSPGEEFFLSPAAETRASGGAGGTDLPGTVLARVWDLVSANPGQIETDILALHPSAGEPDLPAGVYRQRKHPLILGEGVTVEPGVLLDTSDGPIWLDRGAKVRAFTRLAGPAYVGPGSTLLGGSFEAISVGPVCKVRGELAESVCLGYINKAHDGHMGHAYLGRWVNLGAETTNSDLKNNYGTIRMWTPEGDADTGTIKLGCLLGDHVKTGIGLLLNTGTLVGTGSNLYGAAMPPKYVPPFSWGTGEELTEYRLDKFLEVAERAMGRRDVSLGAGARRQLEAAWNLSQEGRGT